MCFSHNIVIALLVIHLRHQIWAWTVISSSAKLPIKMLCWDKSIFQLVAFELFQSSSFFTILLLGLTFLRSTKLKHHIKFGSRYRRIIGQICRILVPITFVNLEWNITRVLGNFSFFKTQDTLIKIRRCTREYFANIYSSLMKRNVSNAALRGKTNDTHCMK